MPAQSTSIFDSMGSSWRSFKRWWPSWGDVKRAFGKRLFKIGIWFLSVFNTKSYQTFEKVDTTLDRVFAKVAELRPNYAQRYDWDALKDDFKYDLFSFLSTLEGSDSRIPELLIRLRPKDMDALAKDLADWFMGFFVEPPRTEGRPSAADSQSEAPGPQDISPRLDAAALSASSSSTDRNHDVTRQMVRAGMAEVNTSPVAQFTLRLLNELKLELNDNGGTIPTAQIKKWLMIFNPRGVADDSLPASPITLPGYQRIEREYVPRDAASFYEKPNGEQIYVKPLRSERQQADAVIEVLVAKLAKALRLDALIADCQIMTSVEGTLVMASQCKTEFEPLVDEHSRLTVRLSVDEQRALYDGLTPRQLQETLRIIAFALLVGDYDCNATNMGQVAGGNMFRFDLAEAFDGIAAPNIEALKHEVSPVREPGRVAPMNCFRDYADLIEHEGFSDAFSALAQGMGDQVGLEAMISGELNSLAQIFGRARKSILPVLKRITDRMGGKVEPAQNPVVGGAHAASTHTAQGQGRDVEDDEVMVSLSDDESKAIDGFTSLLYRSLHARAKHYSSPEHKPEIESTYLVDTSARAACIAIVESIKEVIRGKPNQAPAAGLLMPMLTSGLAKLTQGLTMVPPSTEDTAFMPQQVMGFVRQAMGSAHLADDKDIGDDDEANVSAVDNDTAEKRAQRSQQGPLRAAVSRLTSAAKDQAMVAASSFTTTAKEQALAEASSVMPGLGGGCWGRCFQTLQPTQKCSLG